MRCPMCWTTYLDENIKGIMKFELYKKIIEHLIDNHKEINDIPTNPDFERARALFLKRLGLFKLFDSLRLQLRILKRKIKK